MALLVALLLIFSPFAYAEEQAPESPLRSIVYDFGNPENSVGVMQGKLLEAGDCYEKYQVLTFNPDGIVLRDQETLDTVKWFVEGEVDPKWDTRGRNFFIVKQMRAIYEAEVHYLHEFKDHYAPDLETLIRQGFLADGFENWKKQNYTFQIIESGKKPGLFLHDERKEPFFRALASPDDSENLFFFVDQLGSVRFASTASQVAWGPVWEYMDHSGGPEETYIGLNPEFVN